MWLAVEPTRTLWVCSQIKKCRSWFLFLSTSMILGENVFLEMSKVQQWLSGFAWSWLSPCWCLWWLRGLGLRPQRMHLEQLSGKARQCGLHLKWELPFIYFLSSTIAAKCMTITALRELGVEYSMMWACGLHQQLLESGPQIEKRTKKIKHPITVLAESWENGVIKKIWKRPS